MSSTTIDLTQLPAPDIIQVLDFEQIFAERKAALLALVKPQQLAEIEATLALESEPLTMFLQESAYRELHLRNRINDAARAVMLAYANGGDLDQLAAWFGIERLVITEADPDANQAEVKESNEDLRKRTQLAPNSFSVAGPSGAYQSHALNADGRVLSASATSPAPCEVVVSVLSRNGNGQAEQDLLDIVNASLNPDTVRPLTDLVTVQSAEIIEFAVSAEIFTFPGPDSEVVIAAARASVRRYVESTHLIGRDVTLSGIYSALHIGGVQRVDLTSPPANIIISETQASFCTEIDISHGGIDE